MAQNVLALCDGNIHYGGRLAEYLERQKGFPLRVVFFSDSERFARYVAEHTPPYLMMSEDIFEALSDAECAPAKKLFVLCRHPGEHPGRAMTAQEDGDAARVIRIDRYQAAGNIMRAVLGELDAETAAGGARGRLSKEGTKIIGVFTPVGRSMQTSFSVTLAQLLTGKGRTLYLNLESWSGFRRLLGKELKPDITDLMFFADKEREQFMRQMESMIDTIGSLEYIPPASAFMDLAAITQEQWTKVLRNFREDGRFAYLVLDMTEQVQGMFAVLDECDLIYTIEGGDGIAEAKMYEYERLLDLTEYDGIRTKTKKQRLPCVHFARLALGQMAYGELAGYVSGLVAEDFG